MTSNSSFIGAYKALNELYANSLPLEQDKVVYILKNSGYRFYSLKARYIIYAMKHFTPLTYERLKILAEKDQFEAREFIINNFYGLGMKESSHYLRNLGYFELSIIDRHVLNFLKSVIGLKIEDKLTKKRYLIYEGVLRSISSSLGLQPGLLDLYIWYHETGTIAK